jgi:hypothetical protein
MDIYCLLIYNHEQFILSSVPLSKVFMWLVDQIDYPPVKQEALVEAC